MRLTSNVCQRAVEISRLIAATGGKKKPKTTGRVFLRKLRALSAVLEAQVKGRRVHAGGCLCTSGLTSGKQVSERGSY